MEGETSRYGISEHHCFVLSAEMNTKLDQRIGVNDAGR